MTTLLAVSPSQRRRINAAIVGSLTPAQLTLVRELMAAEKPGAAFQPEDKLFWIRLNLPDAAARIESILYPAD